jgi:hypothetical protein
VQVVASERGVEWAERAGGKDQAAELRALAGLFDWERIYFDALEYKRVAGMDNLAFTPRGLRRIFEQGKFELYCADNQLPKGGFAGLRRCEEVAGAILRKYLASVYVQENRGWEQSHLRLTALTAEDRNLAWKGYEVRTDQQFAHAVRALVKEAGKLYQEDLFQFPRIRFDRHLYQPLLAFDQKDRYDSTPPMLNEGETRLVKDLREWLQKHPEAVLGKEVFLLRNLSRGHGISFFNPKDGDSFYPDFILWVIEDGKQTIAFIDPHGLGRSRGMDDPKIQFHRRLAELQPALQVGCPKWRLALTSFIISPTPYEKMKRDSWIYSVKCSEEQLAAEHVLFQEGDAYVQGMWKLILQLSVKQC